MTAKIAKGRKTTRNGLAAMMAGDESLVTPGTNWNALTVLPATPASTDKFAQPPLHEGITALLIMNGCTAKWAVNFWLVTNKTGQRAHVSRREDWDEWQDAVKTLASPTGKRA